MKLKIRSEFDLKTHVNNFFLIIIVVVPPHSGRLCVCSREWMLCCDSLTRCIAELRGGWGSINSCEGTWPNVWIWASVDYRESKQEREKEREQGVSVWQPCQAWFNRAALKWSCRMKRRRRRSNAPREGWWTWIRAEPSPPCSYAQDSWGRGRRKEGILEHDLVPLLWRYAHWQPEERLVKCESTAEGRSDTPARLQPVGFQPTASTRHNSYIWKEGWAEIKFIYLFFSLDGPCRLAPSFRNSYDAFFLEILACYILYKTDVLLFTSVYIYKKKMRGKCSKSKECKNNSK